MPLPVWRHQAAGEWNSSAKADGNRLQADLNLLNRAI